MTYKIIAILIMIAFYTRSDIGDIEEHECGELPGHLLSGLLYRIGCTGFPGAAVPSSTGQEILFTKNIEQMSKKIMK